MRVIFCMNLQDEVDLLGFSNRLNDRRNIGKKPHFYIVI